jgi:hypothetical protein
VELSRSESVLLKRIATNRLPELGELRNSSYPGVTVHVAVVALVHALVTISAVASPVNPGFTQAAIVRVFVRLSAASCGALAYWPVPLRESAFPAMPLANEGEPTVVALFPVGDESISVLPPLSSIFQ